MLGPPKDPRSPYPRSSAKMTTMFGGGDDCVRTIATPVATATRSGTTRRHTAATPRMLPDEVRLDVRDSAVVGLKRAVGHDVHAHRFDSLLVLTGLERDNGVLFRCDRQVLR